MMYDTVKDAYGKFTEVANQCVKQSEEHVSGYALEYQFGMGHTNATIEVKKDMDMGKRVLDNEEEIFHICSFEVVEDYSNYQLDTGVKIIYKATLYSNSTGIFVEVYTCEEREEGEREKKKVFTIDEWTAESFDLV